MSEVFSAGIVADTMRAEAKTELHDYSLRSLLLDTYAALNKDQLKSVATELGSKNVAASAAPRAEIERENGEVKSLTFSRGNLDWNEASVLTLAGNEKVAMEIKQAGCMAYVSGKEVSASPDHQARYLDSQAYRLAQPRYSNGVAEAAAHLTESAVGASLGRAAVKPALTMFGSATGEMAAAKGSLWRGLGIGTAVETAEVIAANNLKASHPSLAAFLRLNIAEATLVATAASLGGGTMRMRAGLTVGAWLVGKAYMAGSNVLEKMRDH